MDAGRELDALVAEKVMGLQVEQATCNIWLPGERDYLDDGELYIEQDGYAGRVPVYSTDIAAAWLVVEALRGRGYRLNMYESLLGGEYVAMFIGEKGSQCGGTTAPHAICLAALKAVGA